MNLAKDRGSRTKRRQLVAIDIDRDRDDRSVFVIEVGRHGHLANVAHVNLLRMRGEHERNCRSIGGVVIDLGQIAGLVVGDGELENPWAFGPRDGEKHLASLHGTGSQQCFDVPRKNLASHGTSERELRLLRAQELILLLEASQHFLQFFSLAGQLVVVLLLRYTDGVRREATGLQRCQTFARFAARLRHD